MNPEEGEPRPQLVDRFGLVVTVAAPRDPGLRAEVVRRRLAYELDQDAFAGRFEGDEKELAARIVAAQRLLPGVRLPDRELDRIARVCLAYGVDGMRADIVVARCAVALAAWRERSVVTAEEVADAARLALPHRRRKDPLDPPGTDEEKLEQALNEAENDLPPEVPEVSDSASDGKGDDDGPDDPDAGPPPPPPPPPGPNGGDDGPGGGGPPPQAGNEPAANEPPPTDSPAVDESPADGTAPGRKAGAAPAAPGAAFRPRTLQISRRGEGGHAGRRSPGFSRRGRVIGSREPRGKLAGAPHLPATLRAALHRGARHVSPADLREAVHVGREANLVLFVVDASGSMAARKRMTIVKTAVLSLLRDAYHRRDRIGMITFRGHEAEQVLPPTSSHEVGVLRLASLRTGGRTPLAAGLKRAAATIATERRRDPRRRPLLVVVTDGRATSGPDPVTLAPLLTGVATVVVDCESGPVRLGLAGRLAAALDADLMPLDTLEMRSAA
jgi:magnesium chelatase subunit D